MRSGELFTLSTPVNLTNNTFSGNGSGVNYGAILLDGSSTTGQISASTFSNQPTGIRCQNSANLTIGGSIANKNTFSGNTTYGVENTTSSIIVNATSNYWGSDTGPRHTSNPPGTGDPVSNYVDFDPWIGQDFTLTVNKTGSTGTGTVRSNPAGINCDLSNTDCSENYDYGTIVTLTAAPDAGSYFASWTGGCESQALTCKVTMDAAKTVTANFTTTPPAVNTWAKTYGGLGSDWSDSILQTSDGGYIRLQGKLPHLERVLGTFGFSNSAAVEVLPGKRPMEAQGVTGLGLSGRPRMADTSYWGTLCPLGRVTRSFGFKT